MKESGYKKIISLIKEKLKEEENIVVAIAGGSASGKSKIAKSIKNSFPEKSIILSTDDYYKNREFIKKEAEEGNYINLDQPEAVNLDLFKNHLQSLKENKKIIKPIYSMTGEENREETLSPSKIIIIEGLFTLNEKLKDEADIKIFVKTNSRGRLIRRVTRDVKERKRDPKKVIKYFFEVANPMHQKYIEPTKKYADVIISNEYNKEKEGKNIEKSLKEMVSRFF